MNIKARENLRTLRVDQVGSLLRPPKLKAVFVRYLTGQADEQELYEAQDEAILEVVATQEAHALPIITDGEFRRLHFMESFGEVAGMEAWRSKWQDILQALEERGGATTAPSKRGPDPTLGVRKPVTERLRLLRNRPLQEYQFAQSVANSPVKVTPGPYTFFLLTNPWTK